MLDTTQKIQEDQYHMPYHWILSPYSQQGRVYFGYLNICTDLISKHVTPSLTDLSILDAGCGDGRFLKVLVDKGCKNISGVDYSDRAIAFAHLFVPEALSQVASLTSLTQSNETFDVVTLIETLEHIKPEEIKDVLVELTRVLKKNGILIITVPSINLPLAEKHYQHFSKDSLNHIVAPYLKPEECLGQNKLGYKLLKALYLLLDNGLWQIKPFIQWYNKNVWPKVFNMCAPEDGTRVIGVFRKL